MRKVFLFIILFISVWGVDAQNEMKLTDGEPALMYSLPKTKFCIEVEIEKLTQKRGQFYQYAERYLATNQIVTEDKTVYRLKSIRVRPEAIPDSKRTFQYEVKSGKVNNYVTVDRSGLLCGINVPVPVEKIKKKIIVNHVINDGFKSLLPLTEEYLMAGSAAKLAEGAAKQIYRIRESRLTLLSGDMEHLPSDGKSFDGMLKGLDNTEKELTELFTGKNTFETETHTIFFTPDTECKNQVIFRLSALRGLVDITDLGGSPFYINLSADKIQVKPSIQKSKSEIASLNTIIPASSKLNITDGVKVIYEGEFFVPQLGVLMSLPNEILNTSGVKVRIDNETGRLLGVEK